MSQHEVMEAYARLKALHGNLPDRPNRLIEPRYVEDFHDIVGLLQRHSHVDLGRFKVPDTAISINDPGLWYDLHFVKAKVEALLGFFELRWSEPKPHRR